MGASMGTLLMVNIHQSYPVGVQVFTSSYFGQGTGPIFFTGFSCTGTEYSLTDCTHSSSTYYYSHYSDVGVRCFQKGEMYIIIT